MSLHERMSVTVTGCDTVAPRLSASMIENHKMHDHDACAFTVQEQVCTAVQETFLKQKRKFLPSPPQILLIKTVVLLKSQLESLDRKR